MADARVPPGLAFSPLTRDDFALMSSWLAEAQVERWWCDPHDLEALERDYGPIVDGIDPTHALIARLHGRPFGYIQRYRYGDEPEYMDEIRPIAPVGSDTLSLDYLIGEPDARGRGLGVAMIVACVADSWLAFPDADAVVVPVAAGNTASWRALRAAGFRLVGEGPLTPDNPIDPPAHVIYRTDRPT